MESESASSTEVPPDPTRPTTPTISVDDDDGPAGERPKADNSEIFLMLREEPFEFGVLPQTCKHLSLRALKKLVVYWKENGRFPTMTLANWIHSAMYKLKLPYNLACTYFQIYDTITLPSEQFQQNVNWDIFAQNLFSVAKDVVGLHTAQTTEPIVLKIKKDINDVVINTPRFLMFLYIQHWDRPFPKLNNSNVDDVWPPRKEAVAGGTNLQEKMHWDFRCRNFFRRHTFDIILTFLNLGEPNPERVRFEVLQGLDLVFQHICDNNNKVYSSLEKLIREDRRTSVFVEFNPDDNCVNIQKFATWVKLHLKSNPWSKINIPTNHIDVTTGTWSAFPVGEFNRVWHNNRNPPEMWTIISLINEQVFCSDKFETYTSLKIHRCHDSYIYIPGAFRYVTIEKCRNITISLGPVARVIKIVSCDGLKFHGVGRLIMIKNCRRSDLYLMSPNPPIFCGAKNKYIRLAPYNTFYASLEYDLSCVYISTVAANLVTSPVELGFDGCPKENSQDMCYQMMEQKDYREMPFPIKTVGTTKNIPFSLPEAYATTLEENKVTAEMAKATIAASTSTHSETQSTQLKRVIKARFLAWLQENNHQLLMTGLEDFDEAERCKSQKFSTNLLSASARGRTESSIENVVEKLAEGHRENGPATAESDDA